MRRSTRIAAVGALGAIIVVGMVAGAANTSRKCRSAKLQAAGAQIAGEMACYAKAKKSGGAVHAGCLSARSATAGNVIAAAGGVCPGTTAEIEDAVDSCIGAFLAVDPGNGACPAASAKVVGKAARMRLRCAGKVGCETNADGKVPGALAKAGGCVDPAAVVADVHTCDDAIDTLLGPPPPTTTTLVPADVVCCAHPTAMACKYVGSPDNCVAEFGEPSPGLLCNPGTGGCSAPPIQEGSCCTITTGIGSTVCSAGPFYDTLSNCTGELAGTRLKNAHCPLILNASCVH
jgi:hypothetical protein